MYYEVYLSRWDSVMSNIHRQNRMARVAKPGHFNDPDMLQVGNVGLTVTEQYSHMSLWCVASAPLLAGTDIIHASRVTLDILANPEVTAVNQDLGREGAIQVMCCLAWIRSHSVRALNLILEEYLPKFTQSITLHFPLMDPGRHCEQQFDLGGLAQTALQRGRRRRFAESR